MEDSIAFDLGTTIVGILDVGSGHYSRYRTRCEQIEGTKRIISFSGNIVSFNADKFDFPRICEILEVESPQMLKLCGNHNDMMEITSRIRWPSKNGQGFIKGPGLKETYKHYFGSLCIAPPPDLDEYEISNWEDCYMTAELWKKWFQGELLS